MNQNNINLNKRKMDDIVLQSGLNKIEIKVNFFLPTFRPARRVIKIGNRKTDLHVCSRVLLNAHSYCNDILEHYVEPYVHFIGQNFIFWHDNAWPHTARITADYLKEVGIPIFKWPARSPDLNPIEHEHELSRRIKRKINPPTTLQELRIALIKTQEEIPQEVVANLIKSMPRRLEEVIKVRGGNTRY